MINHNAPLDRTLYTKTCYNYGMSYKNTLIVGMAVIGALALLTGTIVTMPAAFAYGDPNEKSIGDPSIRTIGDPGVRVFGR